MKAEEWWSTWAPLWDHIEDRHFGTRTTDALMDIIQPDVLIIGAGQGLIIRYLMNKGINAVGLDINPHMVRIAKEKHGLDIVEGDARDLPFQNDSYATVIISSGVVDYGADELAIKTFIEEAKRVCRKGGNILTAFYRVVEPIEKIYRQIGVIDSNNLYYMERIFEINELAERNPLLCMKPIKKWTGKNYLQVSLSWAKVGLTRPREFMTERKWINRVFQSGAEKGLSRKALIDSVPDMLPYRTKKQIEELMKRNRILYEDIQEFDDCTVVVIKK